MGIINIDFVKLNELNHLFGHLLLFPKSESIIFQIKLKYDPVGSDNIRHYQEILESDHETESLLTSYLAPVVLNMNLEHSRDWMSALIQAGQFYVCLWLVDQCKDLPKDEKNYFRIYCLNELENFEDVILACDENSLLKQDITERNIHFFYYLALAYEKLGNVKKSAIIFNEINKIFPNYKQTYTKVYGAVFSLKR